MNWKGLLLGLGKALNHEVTPDGHERILLGKVALYDSRRAERRLERRLKRIELRAKRRAARRA